MTPPDKGDRPRKIVVCHPDDFARINAAVMSLNYGDVLVRPSKVVPAGQTYVMDDPLKAIELWT